MPYLVARVPRDREGHLRLLTGHDVLPGEMEHVNHGPLGAHLFQWTSLQAHCVPVPVLSPEGLETLLPGQGDWLDTQKAAAENTQTQSDMVEPSAG